MSLANTSYHGSSAASIDDPLVAEVLQLANPYYTVLVRPYFAGQYRIQLTDKRKPDDYAPPGHASIVREMCTYRPDVMLKTVAELTNTQDPEAYCEGLAQPHNCEYPGGRIRLDNRPKEVSHVG